MNPQSVLEDLKAQAERKAVLKMFYSAADLFREYSDRCPNRRRPTHLPLPVVSGTYHHGRHQCQQADPWSEMRSARDRAETEEVDRPW
jgi:hypothetical protein